MRTERLAYFERRGSREEVPSDSLPGTVRGTKSGCF